MTQVAFHFGAPDKLAYACRLLRKASATGARVLVVADAAHCQRLDEQLWAVSPTDFVSHCVVSASASQVGRASVLLTHGGGARPAGMSVLVNLGHEMPSGFDAFKRVIEVVSLDDADRQQARARWKQYTSLGYDIERHDLQLKGAN